jgi:DnaJ-class molecular chaperone
MKVNYYEVLGVERSASEQEIRERFRRLARENHPDRYTGPDKNDAERRFQTLTEAVNVLTNSTRRKQHDAELSSPLAKGGTVDFAQIAKAYMAKGAKAWKESDWRGAYENFDMAVKHNPGDARAQHYLALAAVRTGNLRQAVQSIEAAVQKEPVNSVYLKDAGLICRRAGLVAKAERYFGEALQWDPANLEVQGALAEIRSGRAKKG